MDDPNQTRTHNPSPIADACDESPAHLGRYRILGEIGAGGMGIVYRAEDPQLGRVIAVKVPHLDRRNRVAALARFLREARTAAQVRHPNVCPIHDLGEHNGTPYIVMPFCDGPSLAQVLRSGRLSDDRDAARLAALVADGLAAIHAQGIVHRDLKPGNVLLSAETGISNLTPQITDFGLARPDDDAEHLTHEGAVVGTPAYMSPEQASGDRTAIGPQTDLYALGVILYQMLTGRLPYDGPAARVLADIQSRDPEPMSAYRADIDPRLVAIVRKAMARRSAERYTSARELGDDLRCWLAAAGHALPGAVLPGLPQADFATPSPAGPATLPATSAPRTVRTKWVARAIVATVLVAMAVGAVWWRAHVQPDKEKGADVKRTGGTAPHPVPPKIPEPPVVDKETQKDADARAYLVRALQVCDTVSAEPPITPNKGGRVRPPRVNIKFENEFNGAMNLRELPFVFLVLADLSGHSTASKRLAERKAMLIDRDNFDSVMERVGPRLMLRVPRREGVPGSGPDLEVMLSFRSMKDFRPAAVAGQIPALKAMLSKKETGAAFSAQLADVLTHPEFRKLEGTWRGLSDLVHQTETGEMIKIRVLNATKAELADDQASAGSWDKTTLYRRIYADEYETVGGYPYALAIGDYEFGPDEADLTLLRALGALAERAQVPFVTAAAPNFFGVEQFTKLPAGTDLAALASGERLRAWREFRALPAARFVALTLPRVLARSPYGQWNGESVKEFHYVEPMPEDDSRDNLVWMSAAWPFAAQVAERVARHGWPARLCATRGGDILPKVARGRFHNLTGPGDFARSMDGTLTPRQERELSDIGFMPLMDLPDRGPLFVDTRTAFQSNPTSQTPDGSPDLPALLCATRFTQTITMLAASRSSTFNNLADVQTWLGQWAANYVLRDDPALAAPDMRWKKPLSEAVVIIRQVSDRPGSVELVLQIRPHLHFDAQTPRLRLVIPVPKPG